MERFVNYVDSLIISMDGKGFFQVLESYNGNTLPTIVFSATYCGNKMKFCGDLGGSRKTSVAIDNNNNVNDVVLNENNHQIDKNYASSGLQCRGDIFDFDLIWRRFIWSVLEQIVLVKLRSSKGLVVL